MVDKQKEAQQQLGKALRAVWKRRWAVFIILVATTVAAVLVLGVLPKKYISVTTIRVESDKVINPLTKGLAVSSQMAERLRTLEQEILSPDYMEKVVARLNIESPDVDPLAHRKRIEGMIRNTELSMNRRQIGTFQISYVGRKPAQVRDVTNLLSGIFIEESLSYKESEAGSAFEFLQDQLDVYRLKLEESENALRIFEEQHVDELPSNRSTHLARLEFFRSSINEVRNSISETKIQREILLEKLPASGSTKDSVVFREVSNPLVGRLAELEERLTMLLRQYSENYPDIPILKAEIADVKKQVEENPTVTIEEVVLADDRREAEQILVAALQQLEVELSTLNKRDGQLQREIARYEKKVQAIPQVEQELIRLRRDYDVNSEIYNLFLRRLEDARVSRELEVAKRSEVFRILQSAALPLQPHSPVPWQVVGAGIAIGLALGAGLVYIGLMLDTSFASVEEVERVLKKEVLAAVPRVVPEGKKKLLLFEKGAYGLSWIGYAAGVVIFLFGNQIITVLREVFGEMP